MSDLQQKAIGWVAKELFNSAEDMAMFHMDSAYALSDGRFAATNGHAMLATSQRLVAKNRSDSLLASIEAVVVAERVGEEAAVDFEALPSRVGLIADCPDCDSPTACTCPSCPVETHCFLCGDSGRVAREFDAEFGGLPFNGAYLGLARYLAESSGGATSQLIEMWGYPGSGGCDAVVFSGRGWELYVMRLSTPFGKDGGS